MSNPLFDPGDPAYFETSPDEDVGLDTEDYDDMDESIEVEDEEFVTVPGIIPDTPDPDA